VLALVTGGAGFIGSHLTRTLLQRNDRVRVLDDLSTGHIDNLYACDIDFDLGSVTSTKALASVAKGVNVIYHLAASVGNSRSLADPIGDAETNVIGTINVMEIARRYNIPRVVFSSSAGIFGQLETIPISENHPCEPDSPYGCSKLYAEKMCLAYGRLYGIGVVCLRYFNVYGPNQRYDAYGNVIPIFARHLLRNEPLTIYGNGSQTRDFVHVRDVVMANYRAAASRESGVYNIGSGRATSIVDLLGMMESKSDTHATINTAPPRAGDVQDSVADIAAARMCLGYVPQVELADGIAEYMEWAANQREGVAS
jgi:UDP-glucose 4-epimerase